MKKLLSIVLCMLMVLTVFAACGTSETSTEKKNAAEDLVTAAATEAASEADDGEPAEDETTLAELETIKANGKLVIGTTEYEPMNYLDENGEWAGFDTEFAQAFCETLGIEAEFIVIDWDNKYTELEAGTIDCIWNGMTITEERLENMSISVPYMENKQVLVEKSK